MAENEDAQERTEEATPKRKEDLRKKGQTVRSKELNTFLVLVGGAAGLLLFGPQLSREIQSIASLLFQFERDWLFSPMDTILLLKELCFAVMFALIPLMLVIVVISILSPLSLGGWLWSTEVLLPKIDRLNPISGLKRIFSSQGLMELIKGLFKFVIVSAAGIGLFWLFFNQLMVLNKYPLEVSLSQGGKLLVWSLLLVSASLLAIVLIDVPYQIWSFQKKNKMTKQQVKDEMKETEGKPEVKSRIRRIQREIAQRRMLGDVPEADVVITNPTHYAVALKYAKENGGAPIVVAKGRDLIALKIREIANLHEVVVVEQPALARAIFHTTQLGAEIPGDLYIAVAEVLAYVYRLKAFKQGKGDKPQNLTNVPIPDELHYN